jgi:hypothetical protein
MSNKVWTCSSCEYDDVGGEEAQVFSNKEDAYREACKNVMDFMRDAFESDDEDYLFVKKCWEHEEYEDGFRYWINEVYCPSERSEHPIIDVYSVDVK